MSDPVLLVSCHNTTFQNVFSIRRTDWLVAEEHSDVLHTTITISYGLTQSCQKTITRIGDKNGKIKYSDFTCRPFPSRTRDGCEDDNEDFCATWAGAGYVDYLTTGLSAVAPIAVLFGLSTKSRRRRVWKALAGLTMLQAITGVIAFGLITDMYQRKKYPGFDHARPGTCNDYPHRAELTAMGRCCLRPEHCFLGVEFPCHGRYRRFWFRCGARGILGNRSSGLHPHTLNYSKPYLYWPYCVVLDYFVTIRF